MNGCAIYPALRLLTLRREVEGINAEVDGWIDKLDYNWARRPLGFDAPYLVFKHQRESYTRFLVFVKRLALQCKFNSPRIFCLTMFYLTHNAVAKNDDG